MEQNTARNNEQGNKLDYLKKIANQGSVKDLDEAIALLLEEKKRKEASEYTAHYFNHVRSVTEALNLDEIDETLSQLANLKKRKGRLFMLGIGGSAGNCSHAVNDFRKIANIESYAPTDNVSELTARANDDGWDTIFSNWLKVSNLTANDGIFVLSVGGGNVEKNVSTNIVKALQYAKELGTPILGIVSRDGGYTRKVATTSILVPVGEAAFITPIAEAFQAVVWHLLATHPRLK